jgi:hypothetical protein
MNNLHEQLQKMRNLILSEHGKIKPILTEQELNDKVLLDGACKKWKTMSFEEKGDFTNNSVEILNQDDPIDMDVVCQAAKDDNFEEAIPTEEHRKVIRTLVSQAV